MDNLTIGASPAGSLFYDVECNGKRLSTRYYTIRPKQTRTVQERAGARTGLLILERRANQVYFCVNRDAPVFTELAGLITKTFGIADVIRAALAPLGGRIDVAFIYGSVARSEQHAGSDIDVFFVGEVLLSQLAVPLSGVEKKLGLPIATTIFDRTEFMSRIKKRDHFVSKVAAGPKLFLIGDESNLKALRGGA